MEFFSLSDGLIYPCSLANLPVISTMYKKGITGVVTQGHKFTCKTWLSYHVFLLGRRGDIAMLANGSMEECMVAVYMKLMNAQFM